MKYFEEQHYSTDVIIADGEEVSKEVLLHRIFIGDHQSAGGAQYETSYKIVNGELVAETIFMREMTNEEIIATLEYKVDQLELEIKRLNSK